MCCHTSIYIHMLLYLFLIVFYVSHHFIQLTLLFFVFLTSNFIYASNAIYFIILVDHLFLIAQGEHTYGNGVYSGGKDCCSQFGHCGPSKEHCDRCRKWGFENLHLTSALFNKASKNNTCSRNNKQSHRQIPVLDLFQIVLTKFSK